VIEEQHPPHDDQPVGGDRGYAAALRELKAQGMLTMGIVNAVGSSIAPRDDFGVYCHAGPEIGVASTKAFTVRSSRSRCSRSTWRAAGTRCRWRMGARWLHALRQLPEQVEHILELNDVFRELAQEYKESRNFLYLGRGFQFPVALEGALKLKEVSYIHAEGYPAAEMKHGPIALIDEGTCRSWCFAPQDPVYGKVVSTIEEVKARNGRIIGVVSGQAPELDQQSGSPDQVPQTLPGFQPVLTTIPLQLLAYHIAVLAGLRRGSAAQTWRRAVTVE